MNFEEISDIGEAERVLLDNIENIEQSAEILFCEGYIHIQFAQS